MNINFRILGYIIWISQFISYCSVAFSNPGLPSLLNKTRAQNNEEGTNYRECELCHLYRNLENSTNHCQDCEICIEGNKEN